MSQDTQQLRRASPTRSRGQWGNCWIGLHWMQSRYGDVIDGWGVNSACRCWWYRPNSPGFSITTAPGFECLWTPDKAFVFWLHFPSPSDYTQGVVWNCTVDMIPLLVLSSKLQTVTSKIGKIAIAVKRERMEGLKTSTEPLDLLDRPLPPRVKTRFKSLSVVHNPLPHWCTSP